MGRQSLENALAERVLRTLKEDFGFHGFPSFVAAEAAIGQAIDVHNSV